MNQVETKSQLRDRFLTSTLVIIENAENLLKKNNPPRHIPAYHKILGIQQKFDRLDDGEKKTYFGEMVKVRGIITYFLNGRYKEGEESLVQLKIMLLRQLRSVREQNEGPTDR